MSVSHTDWTDAQSSTAVDVNGHDVETAYGEPGPADATPVVFMHGVSTNTNHTAAIDCNAVTAELSCLWAETDQMQSIEYGERLVEEIGGEMRRLDESFHWVPEDRVEAFATELEALLRS